MASTLFGRQARLGAAAAFAGERTPGLGQYGGMFARNRVWARDIEGLNR